MLADNSQAMSKRIFSEKWEKKRMLSDASVIGAFRLSTWSYKTVHLASNFVRLSMRSLLRLCDAQPLERILPSGHTTLKWRRINVDATWSRRIGDDTTSFWCCVPAGLCHMQTANAHTKMPLYLTTVPELSTWAVWAFTNMGILSFFPRLCNGGMVHFLV